MIIWLASYPKSGNTLLRSIISSYIFSNDGELKFKDLYKISQFPNVDHFKNLNIDIFNDDVLFKNLLNAQKIINSDKKVYFFKTHSMFYELGETIFTDLDNSLATIYIVRDPRNIVTSFSHHYSIPIDEAADIMINKKKMIIKTNDNLSVLIGSWDYNYNSWKQFKRKRFLLIKYEDLIFKKRETIEIIFNFLIKLGIKEFEIDNHKLDNVIKSTDFKKMKNLEKKDNFRESILDKNTGKNKDFFNLGPDNDWKKILNPEIKSEIEKAFQNEMKELGYM